MFTSLGWWPTLIGALIATGRLDDATDQLAALESAADARAINLAMRVTCLRARLALARGDAAAATHAFVDAVARVAADDPILDRAELHHHFGRHLHALGELERALEQLQRAHDLLERVGAAPYRERVDRDLAAAGAPTTRRTGASAPLALTDREHDVVTLVAKGLTNREVAAELYVSTKTVEYHLGNIFGKLGVTSRRQLRDSVATGAGPGDDN